MIRNEFLGTDGCASGFRGLLIRCKTTGSVCAAGSICVKSMSIVRMYRHHVKNKVRCDSRHLFLLSFLPAGVFGKHGGDDAVLIHSGEHEAVVYSHKS